jgi:hypothetical protein
MNEDEIELKPGDKVWVNGDRYIVHLNRKQWSQNMKPLAELKPYHPEKDNV